MNKFVLLTIPITALLCTAPAGADEAADTAEAAKTGEATEVVADREWPVAWFEIFKLAPGRHEAFMRDIALADEVSKAGGLPPVQIFIHDSGADWDVLLYKPAIEERTAEQRAAMDAKAKELNLPSGPAYWVNIRKNMASHTDTQTYGPVTAAEWLARLEKWRAEHPEE